MNNGQGNRMDSSYNLTAMKFQRESIRGCTQAQSIVEEIR
jgi:hypothetical protein